MTDDRYLTTQLIAYIGNKRSLLPFLKDVFIDLDKKHPLNIFGDLFAGSGAVARLGKSLGFSVFANDWEPYSYIINSCHIATDNSELNRLFTEKGGVERAIEYLHRLPLQQEGYISSNYAPQSTETADYRKERLFYTRENGVFIDTVREGIEKLYPGWELTAPRLKEKQVLLASLLYQAATHANTSGVFKAFHKGFGGHGADALSRITRPMRLQKPVLIDSDRKCGVAAEDAGKAVSGRSFDLCYVDPPYNQHQYGSNYHLLNSIVRWDKPEQPLTTDGNGRLRNKGGIRKDWVKTKSDYCYRETALSAFRKLLDGLDFRYIALSYNTEGIMPYEEIMEILYSRGNVRLYSSEYITYRGGRQSISRRTYNVEFLLVCSTAELPKPESERNVSRFFLENKVRTLLHASFYPGRIEKTFRCVEGRVFFSGGGRGFSMFGYHFFTEFPSGAELAVFSDKQLQALLLDLSGCIIDNKFEECKTILAMLNTGGGERESRTRTLEGRFMRALKKIAHKKYILEYSNIMQQMNGKRLFYFQRELDKIREVAEKRFKG